MFDFLGSIAFLIITAFVMSLIHIVADDLERRRGDKGIENALRKWRKEHPDAPPARIHLKSENIRSNVHR